MTLQVVAKDRYEEVAHEYYDSTRHPTSANFRAGSARALTKWLPGHFACGSWSCEVGAGDSLLAKWVARAGTLNRLVLTDNSASMLRYSYKWMRRGATLALTDARRLPFKGSMFELIVASLGDAYNDEYFWHSAARTLCSGGYLVFTVPAFEWALAYRGSSNYAEFDTKTRRVSLPSIVLPESDQIALIEAAGLVVKEVEQIGLSDLGSMPI